MPATPFHIHVSDEKLSEIRRRVADYRWFASPENEAGFSYGMSTPVMKEIQAYWLDHYDWRSAEAELNRWPQFTARIGDHTIHFLHVVGEAGGRRPLLITHGWPGSFYEFWQVIGPLAFPSQYGGDAQDAFDLIIPSLPGYGFSSKPASPIGPRQTGALWDRLMREVLGYRTYLAQGGDWGAMVTSWIGYDHGISGGGGARAIHLNMMGFRPTPALPQNNSEAEWLQQAQLMMQQEGAYLMQQGTKPQTLAMALMDTPMGTAAWILEKFHGWSDLSRKGLLEVYTRDQLLTNIMIYLVNDAIATSVWYYNGFFQEGGNALPEGRRCETPTGFAVYPGEKYILAPPISWAQRAYNITRWREMPCGGHFAAMEVPEIYVEDIRDWSRQLTPETLGV